MVAKLVPHAPDQGWPRPAGAAIVGPTLMGLGPAELDDAFYERDTLDESMEDKGRTLHGIGDLDHRAPRPGRDDDWQAAQHELLDVLHGIQVGPRPAMMPPAMLMDGTPTHCWPEGSARMSRRASRPGQEVEDPQRARVLAWLQPIVWMSLIVLALALGFGLGRFTA